MLNCKTLLLYHRLEHLYIASLRSMNLFQITLKP